MTDKTNFVNATFVDNTTIVVHYPRARPILHQSVQAAHEIYEVSEDDQQSACISHLKWNDLMTFAMLFIT